VKARSPLTGFLLRVLLWLPICFFVWYQAAPVLNVPPLKLSAVMLRVVLPGLVTGIESKSEAAVKAEPPAQHRGTVMGFNPLLHTLGLPFFVALTLAAPGPGRLKKLAIGVAAIVVVQAVGITATLAKDLFDRIGMQHAVVLFHLHQWQIGLLVLVHKMALLVLPTVAPVVLWILLHRQYLEVLLDKSGGRAPAEVAAPTDQGK